MHVLAVNRRIGKALKIVLIGGLLLVFTAIAINWVSGKNGPSIQIVGGGGGKLETKDGKIVVPRDRVPKDFSERDDAPAVSLLPNRLPYTNSGATVSPEDRAGIAAAVTGFLKHWETFDPVVLDRDSRATNRISPYKLSLQKWSAPEDLGDLVARVDSTDPPGVCPTPGCTDGSIWMSSGDIGSAMTIVQDDGRQAYVTLYGLVEYTGESQFDALAGSIWFRSYGLLLEKSGGRWLVTRAAAETMHRANT